MTTFIKDTRAIARDWLRVARGDPDANPPQFFRFVSTWIAFNALYSSAPGNREREQVRHFGRESHVDVHRALLADPDYSSAIAVLGGKGIERRNGTRVKPDAACSLESVLDCVYQVRCNLFHGDKRPFDDRDRRLVDAATAIVHHLVERAV